MVARCLFIFSFAVLLAACNVHPRGIRQVGNWGPTTFLEDGIEVHLYTHQIEEYHGPTLIYLADDSTYSAILTERPTVWIHGDFDHAEARELWHTASPWRREENLQAISQCLTYDQPKNLRRILISSYNPVVIGISDDADASYLDCKIDITLQGMILQGSRAPRIQLLLICDHWPTPDARLGPIEDRRVIQLPSPNSLCHAA